MAFQTIRFKRIYSKKVHQIVEKHGLRAHAERSDEENYYVTFRGPHEGIREIIKLVERNMI